MSHADHDFMQMTLRLAARGLGDTWPNPAVGCVIVKDGVVVGRGWTQSGGRPHAETEALQRAGSAAKGATAYVSLEPCSHHGKTPPCAEALIAAGIARVVVAATDPDPRVSGQGTLKLRAAKIDVVDNICRAEAEHLNAGFFKRITQQRPLFALKTATSLDGRIALANGESKWITGPEARRATHAIRARFDAVLVGSETVIQDDPELTCRLPGYTGRPKVRIVLDRRLRVATDRKVIQTAASVPTWIYTTQAAPKDFGKSGATVVQLGGSDFLAAVAADLAAKGITRVLIEGGGQVAAAFLKAGLIDELYWFRGAQVLGGDGVPAVAALGLDRLTVAPHFKRRDTMRFSEDILEVFERR
ncbi:MAG: bifunctional diaminohydroxyphosphoribosylaminopyrimidine deaminase/5-amino-6-(5-phosphoribosylamino)uracil reductase RibD [Rhodospirillaceae bacterium]|nr:bifunctional diaminohydroxyphosphoribosylaminopyrimidine deaminase/5-amino-6-(5-phosphoribosylamino)uracil reductase RibD [Rhodospirillaceae bacterium]